MSEKPLNVNPVVVIGIDGSNWKVLDNLIANGYCPNLSKMIKDGTIAETMADDVLLSPIIWTSVGTGKKGNKHKINSFLQTSSDIQCRTIWEILSENEVSCGIFHWPVSSPPTQVFNGFNIPSYSQAAFTTYPKKYIFLNKMLIGNPNLRKTVSSTLHNYAIILASSINATKYGLSFKDCLNWIIDITIRKLNIVKSIKQRSLNRSLLKRQIFGVFLHKLEVSQPDFICFYMAETDHLQHFFWDEFFLLH